MFAIAEHLDTVDPDVRHTGRVLVRPVKGGMVLDLGWIEYHHIGKIARLERAPPVESQILTRQTGQPPDSLG